MEALDPASPGQPMQLCKWWLLEDAFWKGTLHPIHGSLVKCFPGIFLAGVCLCLKIPH